MNNNLEWIFSGLGVYALTLLLGSAGYLLRRGWRMDPRLVRLIGTYEAFQLRIRNDGTVLKSAVIVRRHGLNGLSVDLRSYRYHYQGSCEVKGHNVFFSLEEVSHDGYMHLVFKEPASAFNILVGVYSGITSNRRPVAGKMVLKRSELSTALAINPSFVSKESIPRAVADQLSTVTGALLLVEDLSVNLLEEIATKGT